MNVAERNVRMLLRFTPLRGLVLSPAYITPFLLAQGLSLQQILLLQAVYSVAYILWEVPTGWFADTLGRVRSITLSVPLLAGGITGYGLSHSYWHFVVFEVVLALGNALVSGADKALLYDSLAQSGKQDDYDEQLQHMRSRSFWATVVGVPASFVLVLVAPLAVTLVADGVLTAYSLRYVLQLREMPHAPHATDHQVLGMRSHLGALLAQPASYWLVLLGTVLGATTYLGFWLTTPYYDAVGVPVWAFGVVFAARNAFKALLASKVRVTSSVHLLMYGFALLVLLVPLGMWTASWWLVWVVLGHDVVHALHEAPLDASLNRLMASRYRATLNSMVSVVQRLGYSLAGPLAGWAADRHGYGPTLTVCGVCASAFVVLATGQLRSLGFFSSTKKE